ncbi:MAG: flagellar hook-length control protein FliK [Clostridiales bacterium]|nr:flagellar hook-length control protein FliK [Clostridiales bacterium]
MELTSMFLNQLTNKPINSMSNTNRVSNGFNDVLVRAESKTSNVKDDNKNYKSSNNTKDKNFNNSQVDKYKNKQVVDNDNIKIDNKKEAYTDKIEKEPVSGSESVKDEEQVIIVDEKVLNQLSEILGISTDKIMEILSSLSLSLSMLQDPENLIKFLQNSFNLENPIQLLSMDNIKDVMKNITDIAKSINYTDVISIDENAVDKLNNILEENNLKDVTLLGSKDDSIKQKIANLLEELNGSVKESSENTSVINNINVKINLSEDNSKLSKNTEELVNIEEIRDIKVSNQETGYYQENEQNNKNSNQNLLLGEKVLESVVKRSDNQEIFSISEVNNNTKVFNASLPKTQALKNINAGDVIAQIMEKLKVSVKPDLSEVKILLRPEQLGEVSLKIATQNGIITAQFIAESQKVKEIIESNFNQLRDMLSEQGVDVGALEVNVSNSDEEKTTYNMFEQNSEKGEKRINDLIENSFEKEELIREKEIKEEHIINSQVNYSI